MQVHGEFEIQLFDRILYIQYTESINKEGATVSANKVKKLVEPLITSGWATFTDYRDWQFMSPDAFDQAREFNQWILDHGHQASVFISPPSSLKKHFILESMKGVIVPPGFKFLRTNDISEGLQWLESLGFSINEDLIAKANGA